MEASLSPPTSRAVMPGTK
jgi:hypothetical protein